MTTIAPPRSYSHDLMRTARTTGLLYLAMGIAAVLGFLLIRNQLYVAGDPAATLANLTDNEGLMRAGVVFETTVVGLQVVLALWFFRLFRGVDSFAAGAITVLAAMNAVAILGSATMLGVALELVHGDQLVVGDPAALAQTLYVASENFWSVGNLFFGLWLVPMGWLALRSGWFPKPIGWLLLVGGVPYAVSGLLAVLAPGAGVLAGALVVPGTIGEFWILGYLIILGLRR